MNLNFWHRQIQALKRNLYSFRGIWCKGRFKEITRVNRTVYAQNLGTIFVQNVSVAHLIHISIWIKIKW